MKNNFMVDIETLGTRSYSIILSIGVVAFDLKTGNTGDEFYRTIDVASSKEVGLTSDASTVEWWRKQDKSVRDALTKNTAHIHQVLTQLLAWFDMQTYERFMWGNSARFDLGLLENAYERCKLIPPWAYYNERCCRTIVALNPEIKNSLPKPTGAHHPIIDCKHQIDYIVKTIQSHEGKENNNLV
jgi:hypothetical protein